MFSANILKYQNFSAENFQFLELKKSMYITWASFRNTFSEADILHNPIRYMFLFAVSTLLIN